MELQSQHLANQQGTHDLEGKERRTTQTYVTGQSANRTSYLGTTSSRAGVVRAKRQCELSKDRDLFEIPLEARLQQSVSIMRTWVTSTSKTLGICMNDFAAATARTNSDIRHHLPIRARIQPAPPLQPPPAPLPTPPEATSAAAATPAVEGVSGPIVAPAQAMAREPEIQVLMDTSSSSSSSGSSSNSNRDSDSDGSALQRTRAAVLALIGKPRRRAKGIPSAKQQRRQQKATTKATTQDSDTDTAPESDSEQENKEPPIAKKFTPKPKKQSTLTSFNFGRERAARQQTPKANDKDIKTTGQIHQQGFSPQPEQHRRREVSSGGRVWDAGRVSREGGGGPARVAKFRDRSTQQLGSAADSAPVV
jgi:hypothetical protein